MSTSVARRQSNNDTAVQLTFGAMLFIVGMIVGGGLMAVWGPYAMERQRAAVEQEQRAQAAQRTHDSAANALDMLGAPMQPIK